MPPELLTLSGGSRAQAAVAASELLTFSLGAEYYGVDILKVQEIRGYDTVTRIPDAPTWLKGVINLRGTIVPVIDLRIKFRLSKVEYNEFTVMIILSLSNRTVGIVVDAVSDVTQLGVDQIKPAPEFGAGVDTQYISGLGALDDRMLILVDIERLLQADDLAVLAAGGGLAAHH